MIALKEKGRGMESRVRISVEDGEFVVRIPEDIASDWGARDGLIVDVMTSGGRLVLQKNATT